MRKLTLTLSAAALALAVSTTALADHHGGKNGPDGDGDGVITLEEMTARSAKMFAHMDANGDGKIDQSDREAHQERRAGSHAEHFAKADTNGDGELSPEEMKAAHEARMADREDRMAERHETMMAKLDTDKSGGLSVEELAAARMAHQGHMGAGHGKQGGPGKERHGMAMHMLKMADTDGDKAVTRAEFDAAATKHFAEVDTDNSGTISAAERSAAHEKMKARMMQHRDAS